ncbi:Protein alcS [Aspergillus cristatus]|uniref:Protein alcS n=1 Tax=Aspergillus cristatus TaxID=573508 RepID=A0A1E3B0S3_ASPCR|nr:Protein alcS [Aspergillus cristatus]
MVGDINHNGERNAASHNKESSMYGLSTVPTSVTLTAEQFERLYLTPMTRRQPPLAKQVGNPTPLALGGFVITTTPLSCCLMAWRGASGNGIAFTGPIIFLGGLLLLITSVLEFVLGNTFPCVVFGTIGGFWFAFAATMIPAFNAAAPYSPSTTDTGAGLLSTGFMNTYAFLFISMAVLMLIFMICATRTNVVYTLIFLSLLLVFLLLSSAYWRLGLGDAVVGNRCVIGAGASLFAASIFGFYLLIVQLFDAMGFPFNLPVGDLGKLWVPALKKVEQRDLEMAAAANDG